MSLLPSSEKSSWPSFCGDDSSYAVRALMTVDDALDVLSSGTEVTMDRLHALWRLCADIWDNVPYQKSYRSDRPQDSWVAPGDEFRFRTPVWGIVTSAIACADVVVIQKELSQADLARHFVQVLRHHVLLGEAEKATSTYKQALDGAWENFQKLKKEAPGGVLLLSCRAASVDDGVPKFCYEDGPPPKIFLQSALKEMSQKLTAYIENPSAMAADSQNSVTDKYLGL